MPAFNDFFAIVFALIHVAIMLQFMFVLFEENTKLFVDYARWKPD